MKNLVLLSCAMALCCAGTRAEERWAWSSSKRNGRGAVGRNERSALVANNRRPERLEDFSDDAEHTTRKPQQDDDYPGNNGFGGQRVNFNGAGFPGGPGGPGGFPGGNPGGFPGGNPGGFPGGNPGGFPGGNPGGFPGGNPGFAQGSPGGGFPQQPGFGGVGPVQFPGAPNGYGGGFGGGGGGGQSNIGIGINQFSGNGVGNGYRPGGGYYPGGGGGGLNNNVLVGPGGPTGIIGRPNGYQQTGVSPPVLVGPGGPTGIVGRPPVRGGYGFPGAPNGYGGGVGGGYGGGFGGGYGGGYGGGQGQGGYSSIGIGINSNNGPQAGFGGRPPGGFGGGGFGGGILPYNSGSQIPAFDEPEAGDGKEGKQSRKVEGKEKH